ncbi:MAG: hypothetical protein Q9220_005341 [cf. Caloplaca sp. 1 TL-2023]
MAFNAKNLTYESKPPAFLEKLRGAYSGADKPPSQWPQPRPKKQPQADEDSDDDPVYVFDERIQEPMTRAQYQSLVRKSDAEQCPLKKEEIIGENVDTPDTASLSSPAHLEEPVSKAIQVEKLAAIGGSSKKRSVRIVEDNTSGDEIRSPMSLSPNPAKQSLKKRKRPKLSFEGDGE